MARFDESAFTVIASDLLYPEGPVARPDGSVLLVEVKEGTSARIRPDGTKEVVANLGEGPNGAAIGPDGAVYVCNSGGFQWVPTRPLWLTGDQPPGLQRRLHPARGFRGQGDHPLRRDSRTPRA